MFIYNTFSILQKYSTLIRWNFSKFLQSLLIAHHAHATKTSNEAYRILLAHLTTNDIWPPVTSLIRATFSWPLLPSARIRGGDSLMREACGDQLRWTVIKKQLIYPRSVCKLGWVGLRVLLSIYTTTGEIMKRCWLKLKDFSFICKVGLCLQATWVSGLDTELDICASVLWFVTEPSWWQFIARIFRVRHFM